MKACSFIKKRVRHRCFPINIAKCFRTAFFIEHRQWLLLHFTKCIYHNQRIISVCYGKFPINLFLANTPISYPLKISENLWFSGDYRGYKIGTLVRNGWSVYTMAYDIMCHDQRQLKKLNQTQEKLCKGLSRNNKNFRHLITTYLVNLK